MGGFGNEVGSFDWVSEEDGLAAIRRVRAAERLMQLEDLIRRREAGVREEPEVYEDPAEYDPVLRWHCRLDE